MEVEAAVKRQLPYTDDLPGEVKLPFSCHDNHFSLTRLAVAAITGTGYKAILLPGDD